MKTKSKIYLDNQTNLDISNEPFETVLDVIIKNESLLPESFINLMLSNDGSIRKYNKKYLGRDELTDVISFEADMPGVPLLGDVIIDISVADKQRSGKSLLEELQELFLHGVLHLIGYDHLATTQADIMKDKEMKYIKILKENN